MSEKQPKTSADQLVLGGLEGHDKDYVQLQKRAHIVFYIRLPTGTLIGLTAEQLASTVVEDHGNYGRSRIRFSVELEVQAQGNRQAYETAIRDALIDEIRRQEEENAKVAKARYSAEAQLRVLEEAARSAQRAADAGDGKRILT